MLTHDVVEAQRYRDDDLIFRQIPVNVLLDLHDTSTRLLHNAPAIHVPTLVLSAGSDWVVSVAAQRRFFECLESPDKAMRVFPAMSHAIFHERDRRAAIVEAGAFIRERFRAPAPATRDGRVLDGGPVPGRSARFVPVRWAVKTIGRLSAGIRLGWRAGFDSGVMLDYVYANQPRGTTPLGRLLDRAFLNSIGWRGIRQRKVHLGRLLHATIARVHADGRPVRLLDIASGPGRYLLETIRASNVPVTALLRDYRQENLSAGRALARRLALPDVEFTHGDAFDRPGLAAIRPRPTIAIVSGLYELFSDNARVLKSLRGVAEALEPGGYLVYTNQPWHPQLNFIANVLVNREGQPWVMRCRSQAEMDDLAATAGFEKLDMAIDRWGIFTVSVARRAA
jgi:SAM-dependent methyltransferase